MLWDPNKDIPAKTNLDEVSLIMIQAADYLKTHRWGQHDFVLNNGAVCLMGALQKVETGKVYSCGSEKNLVCPLADSALNRVERYLNRGVSWYHQNYLGPFRWNDRPERTKAEVIEVLRQAAVYK